MSIDIRAIPAAFAASTPVTQNFQWSASNTTAVPAASTALSQPSADSTVNVTAGSGVTALTAQVQATQDNSNWTTIGTVNLTAAGSASIVVGIPYLGLRVNVTALSGGNASATLVEGQAPLSASGGTVLTSPQLTGVPQAGASLVSQWGVPVIIPSSGSIGNNGALTLTTALNTTFANCWMYFPANAISAGSAAGIYFVQMSSTTAGTIYNNTLTAGAPTIPASPTAFSTTGPGAYTQTTSAVDLVTLTILGGSMGANGSLRFKSGWITPNNANSKQTQVKLGGSAISTYSPASQQWLGQERTLRNMGVTNAQVAIAAGTSISSDVGASSAAPSFLSINTANNQNMAFSGLIGTATDYMILAGATVEIIPAA
jgi:hypothetical protein